MRWEVVAREEKAERPIGTETCEKRAHIERVSAQKAKVTRANASMTVLTPSWKGAVTYA